MSVGYPYPGGYPWWGIVPPWTPWHGSPWGLQSTPDSCVESEIRALRLEIEVLKLRVEELNDA